MPILAAGLLLVGLGAGSYFLGESNAPTAGEAADIRETSFADAAEGARAASEEGAFERGVGEGLAEGRTQGERRGGRDGVEQGRSAAGEELAAIEAQEAEAAATAVTPAPTAPEVPTPCPPADQLCNKVAAGVLPTGPNPNCPPGQVPAGVTGACAPRE